MKFDQVDQCDCVDCMKKHTISKNEKEKLDKYCQSVYDFFWGAPDDYR
jgi:hypothetical protein